MSVNSEIKLDAPELLTEARILRERVWGKQVFVRGIVEFSNFCRQNCLYCGLRRDNRSLMRYRLNKEQILGAAGQIKELGMGTVVLQSGEDLECGQDFISDLIKSIKNDLGLAVTLSLGERAEIKTWRAAGADRYLLKTETFSPALYRRLRPGRSLAERLHCLEDIRQAGYETGSGIITGLPWQTRAEQSEDLARLVSMELDMVSLSPFIPHPQTPLAQYPANPPEENLRALAVTRKFMPFSHIPVTSALALYGEELKLQALNSACDVLMLSLTPAEKRAAYNIYPGKNSSILSPRARACGILNNLRAQGFILPDGAGGAWGRERSL